MKLIVGLGNPGLRYKDSRHNIGFCVAKELAREHGVRMKKEGSIQALCARFRSGTQGVLLAMPMTFMNLSGSAVKGLAVKYKIELPDILVVCDDLDLELGSMRIRPGGSSGGQKGLASVIDSLGRSDFARLRIGIGRPGGNDGEAVTRYVLSPFGRRERKEKNEMLKNALLCCESWLHKGIEETMNVFNRRNLS